jgi:hypothetical protein
VKFDPDRYVRRIVIESLHENPGSPELVTKPEYEFVRFDPTERLIRPAPPTIFEIKGISSQDWKITWETDYPADFKRVASVVGKDKAGEVLRALKRAVPENWEAK